MCGLGWGLYWWVSKRGEPAAPQAAAVVETPAVVETKQPEVKKDGPFERPKQAAEASSSESVGGQQLAKYLEATGIRISEERRRTVVTMTIVNHSNAEMMALEGSIKLSTKDGSKTVATVPFKLAQLGPLEAKDYTVPILTTMRAYELPDWQFLRAELTLR